MERQSSITFTINVARKRKFGGVAPGMWRSFEMNLHHGTSRRIKAQPLLNRGSFAQTLVSQVNLKTSLLGIYVEILVATTNLPHRLRYDPDFKRPGFALPSFKTLDETRHRSGSTCILNFFAVRPGADFSNCEPCNSNTRGDTWISSVSCDWNGISKRKTVCSFGRTGGRVSNEILIQTELASHTL